MEEVHHWDNIYYIRCSEPIMMLNGASVWPAGDLTLIVS